MRIKLSLTLVILMCSFAQAQNTDTKWYSESTNKGVTIQNSYNKGGPYLGPVEKYHNVSNLIYFTRILNETEKSLKLTIHFSADSFAIPNSPNTYVKLFLPPDTMSVAKQDLFSYGVEELESFDEQTKFQRTLKPNEDCYFNVVAIFYQTREDAIKEERGGNRTELVLKGNDLFYRMPPQIDLLPCGHIVFNE